MNPIADPLLMELDQEAQSTRRVLERVPENRLDWKPHPKSFSLGQLALHTAQVPGALAAILTDDSYEVTPFSQAAATSKAELLAALDTSVAQARTLIEGLTPERAMTIWQLTHQGSNVMGGPRIGLVRALMFNHMYHHRGQLQVYLRMLDVPVPSVYGPTADENPFAPSAA
jgi:uncharacterized damage-inducible protein DinB